MPKRVTRDPMFFQLRHWDVKRFRLLELSAVAVLPRFWGKKSYYIFLAVFWAALSFQLAAGEAQQEEKCYKAVGVSNWVLGLVSMRNSRRFRPPKM